MKLIDWYIKRKLDKRLKKFGLYSFVQYFIDKLREIPDYVYGGKEYDNNTVRELLENYFESLNRKLLLIKSSLVSDEVLKEIEIWDFEQCLTILRLKDAAFYQNDYVVKTLNQKFDATDPGDTYTRSNLRSKIERYHFNRERVLAYKDFLEVTLIVSAFVETRALDLLLQRYRRACDDADKEEILMSNLRISIFLFMYNVSTEDEEHEYLINQKVIKDMLVFTGTVTQEEELRDFYSGKIVKMINELS